MSARSSIWLRLLRVLIAVSAYAYLAYMLLTYEGYGALWVHFRSASWGELALLLGAILLFPLNIELESVKWRYLLRPVLQLSRSEARAQTYFGLYGAFLSPERLGEYPARVMRIEDRSLWPSAIAMGFVGSMALDAINILFGFLAIAFLALTPLGFYLPLPGIDASTLAVISVAMLLLYLLLLFLLPVMAGRLRWLAPLRSVSLRQFSGAMCLSTLRYLVYACQLAMVLFFCGISLSPSAMLLLIPIYYMVVTILPCLPVADAAIRGSVSALIFSACTPDTAPVALAAILLWAINTLLPMLLGSVFFSASSTSSSS